MLPTVQGPQGLVVSHTVLEFLAGILGLWLCSRDGDSGMFLSFQISAFICRLRHFQSELSGRL